MLVAGSGKALATSQSVTAESADAAAVNDELHKRLQDAEGCSGITSGLDGGILEVLLKELNDKGQLYRENGYLSNAVEKPEDLRVGPADQELVRAYKYQEFCSNLTSSIALSILSHHFFPSSMAPPVLLLTLEFRFHRILQWSQHAQGMLFALSLQWQLVLQDDTEAILLADRASLPALPSVMSKGALLSPIKTFTSWSEDSPF